MLLTGLSALRTYENLIKDKRKEDKLSKWSDAYEMGPEQFVEYATSALAPIAWHIIKGFSHIATSSSAAYEGDDMVSTLTDESPLVDAG